MTNIFVRESFINKDTDTLFSETEIYQTRYETPSEVYRFCLREYGRCTSKVYITDKNGDHQTGWTFLKRDKYQDSRDTYLREVWVGLYDESGEPMFINEAKQ